MERAKLKEKAVMEKCERIVKLKVGGMSCGGCVKAVERALKSTAGVADAVVDLAAGSAEIKLADMSLDPNRLVLAVKAAGYEARLIE
jgi:copper chaperone CopZ